MTIRVLLGTALAAALVAGAAHSEDLTEIRIGAGISSGSAPSFVAVAKGIYAKHGLDAKLVLEQTGVELINGLMAQNTDVAELGSTPFLSGVSKGMPLVLIGHLHGDASRADYSNAFSVVASKESGVDEGDIKAFAGKKIGFPRGSGAETYANGLMTQAGLKLDDATLVNLKPSDTPTALRNGDVDLIAIWEPWATTATLKVPGAKRIIQGGCETCYDPGAILTVRATIAEKEEVLQRYLAAVDEAMQWMRANPEEAAEITMRWVPGTDLDVMQEAIKYESRDSRLSKNTVEGYEQRAIPTLVAGGRLDGAFEVMPAIDPQFSVKNQMEHPGYFADLPAIPDDKKF